MATVAVGAAGVAFEMIVERGKVAEFARATKAVGDYWQTGDASFSPPTFLTTDRFWAGPDATALGDAPLNWARLLHGEQEFVFHGPPPRAGDRLIAQQRVQDCYAKQGKRGGTMSFIVLLTEYHDPAGNLVAEARSTVIQTSQAAAT